MSTNRSDDELKQEIYAVLFSIGKRMLIDELAKVVKEKDIELVTKILVDLKEDLEAQNGPVMLLKDGDEYKLAVRGKFLNLVQKVVKHAEMPKTILETLAVIAYKTPVLQSDVIKIRTNKAYEHLARLEEEGYISREKHGRTKLIKVTNKFYDYFEISPEELQKKFEKKQLQEGEQQLKITAIKDNIHGLELYGKKETHDLRVYKDETKDGPKVKDSDLPDADSPFDDTGETKEITETDTVVEFIEPEIDTDTQSDVQTDKNLDIAKPDEPKKDIKDNKQKDAKSDLKKPDLDLPDIKKRKKKKRIDKEKEPEFEPIKVKGGFKKFSKDEKEKIKETADDITGEKD